MRFAVLIRVSTEKQEKKGESLHNQRRQLEAAVDRLGGEIYHVYGGQEHATSGWERKELNTLLADAQKDPKPFDAVMVYDASRWSRDNAESKRGLEILRSNEIRFFTLSQEHSLHDPCATLFLGMATEIGEYQARMQKKKSVESCIERARRTGAPTGGKKPFGREWNKQKEVWEVIPEKQTMIQDVAKRYLNGEPLSKLAKEYEVNHSNLHKVLTKKCGDTYQIKWNLPDLKIDEEVTIKIPELLSKDTIQKINHRAKANKTYQHGRPKHPYLLSGYVFCAECGYAMFGQTNHNGKQYYRHAHTERAKECPLKNPRPWVACHDLEHAVIEMLFEVFGNRSAMLRAIEKATPDQEKLNKLREDHSRVLDEMKDVLSKRDKILDLITKSLITDSQAEQKLLDLNELEEELKQRADQLDIQIGNHPTKEELKRLSQSAAQQFRKRVSAKAVVARRSKKGMTWQDKRELVKHAFDGDSLDGRPHGVYIHVINGQQKNRRKRWKVILHGQPMIEGDSCVTQCASG